MHSLMCVSVVVCVARKPRPCLSYSRRRDRINSVLLCSYYKGGGVLSVPWLMLPPWASVAICYDSADELWEKSVPGLHCASLRTGSVVIFRSEPSAPQPATA